MGVHKDMNKLSSTLTTVQAVLEDAEDKQFDNEPIRNWLCKLSDLTYEIDDILDDYATQVSRAKFKTNSNPTRYLKNISYRSKIGRRMKKVTKILDEVAAERTKFHLREVIIDRQSFKIASTRETCSVLNDSHPVYGRDEDKEKIVDILVNQNRECKELSILPIIGMGGLGKTTLAQLVFNDQRVADHFEIKLWVCVSDYFDCLTLMKAILESASGNGRSSDLSRLDTIQRLLSELLSNKRYLLVLDDVWNEDQEKWSLLKSFLSCNSSGASIIVTTRLRSVADIMSILPPHNLTELSEEDCWLLFKLRAFRQDEKEHPNLEAIGKQIVKKCAGVPLAAKSLGGLLRFKRNENEWINVKESEVWNLPQTENSILPALKLSYKHLPPTLRQCFALCAIFPKDTWIYKKELIFMWMSHGYISSCGTMEVEDIGNDVWNELVLRGLFQDITTKQAGYGMTFGVIDEIKFKMHDLIHDLAQSIMENKIVGTMEINNRNAPNTKIRHVNLDPNSGAFPRPIVINWDLPSTLMTYRRLRILNASSSGISIFPSAIRKLKLLRSLSLSGTTIRILPDDVCNLWNLKILNLNHCESLVSLPKKLKDMLNLRHLSLEGCRSLTEMPPSIGELTSLQTLSLFIVGHEKTNQLKELEGLNIGGVLEIKHLERVKNFLDAKKANLDKKQNLCKLILQWEVDDNNVPIRSAEQDDDEKIFEALEPHSNLRKLRVNGFKGSNFPLSMGNYSTLQNLAEIEIEKCPNCLRLPQGLGELPNLEYLVLTYLPLLQYMIEEVDTGGRINTVQKPKFPRLKYLELDNLENLKGILKRGVDGDIIFPNLQRLSIEHCLEFVVLSEEIKNFQNTLKYLTLVDLPMMICLPDSLQHFTSLEYLTLWNLPLFTSLPDWFGNLTSFQKLLIINCPNIASLPTAIQGMVNLKELNIQFCPELKRRCEKEIGEDWHKIAHIERRRII